MHCRCCGSSELVDVYKGRIRDGSFGNVTDTEYCVLKCRRCSVRFLDPFPSHGGEFYETDEYRRKYDGSSDVVVFQELHDHIQGERVGLIGLERLRNRSVADVGTGAGAFLDAVYGVARETIAVEPALFWKDHLKTKHDWHPSVDQLAASGRLVDMVVSFETIEHVIAPSSFVSGMASILRPGGEVFLTTVNCDSIYDKLLKEEWDRFNYRSAHLYYFDATSLRTLLQAAGFEDISISYNHEYDLSNLCMWLRDKRPTGVGLVDVFDEALDAHFKRFCEATGLASTIWVSANKPS